MDKAFKSLDYTMEKKTLIVAQCLELPTHCGRIMPCKGFSESFSLDRNQETL